MGIREQATYSGSLLSPFLDERLPHRDPVVQAWTQQMPPPSSETAPPVGGRDSAGWALELGIGLDVATAPPRLRDLSYLPIDRCAALLAATGYEHRTPGVLPTNNTTDPVLRRWVRTHHPITINDASRAVFAACLDLSSISQPIHRWGTSRSVDERRSWFASLVTEKDSLGSDTELLDMLTHCWTAYLDHGRRALLELGEKVVVAPELAHGYGVADLVIGRTLIDIKLASQPTPDDVAIWLRQLLGYVLLDRHNIFGLDTIAVYCGWHGHLLSYPLPALLATAAPGPVPTLDRLRTDFSDTLRDDLDGYAAWKERQRYS